MQRSMLLSAASAALLLAGASFAKAATSIYGFDSASVDGFALAYDGSDAGTASVTQSTSTGVTQGTGALKISTGVAGGYDQTDAFTGTVPAALVAPGTTSLSLDLTFNPNGVAYAGLSPVFFLEGGSYQGGANVDKKLLPAASATGENTNLASLVYNGTTLTYNLQAFKDPYGATDGDGTTALYTPGQIAAAVNAASPGSGAALPTFGFEEINGGTAALTPPGLSYYIDNVTVPSAVPEPTSLAGLAIGGLMLARRRRPC